MAAQAATSPSAGALLWYACGLWAVLLLVLLLDLDQRNPLAYSARYRAWRGGQWSQQPGFLPWPGHVWVRDPPARLHYGWPDTQPDDELGTATDGEHLLPR